jgi:hypothetical protein
MARLIPYDEEFERDYLPDDYYDELIYERERRRLERDNELCGYIPPEEGEDDEWTSCFAS